MLEMHLASKMKPYLLLYIRLYMLELLLKNLQRVDMLVVINASKHDIVCFIIGDSVLLFVNQHSAQYNACMAHSWYLVNFC